MDHPMHFTFRERSSRSGSVMLFILNKDVLTAQPPSGVMTVASQATLLPQIEPLHPSGREAGLCNAAQPFAKLYVIGKKMDPLGKSQLTFLTSGWQKGNGIVSAKV